MSTLWRIVVAAAFILLGLFAIVEPTVAGLAAAVLVGWLLLFSGVAHVVGAFFVERHGWSRLWTVLLGVLYVVGGGYFVTHPLLGLGTLTLFLAAILIMATGSMPIVNCWPSASRICWPGLAGRFR